MGKKLYGLIMAFTLILAVGAAAFGIHRSTRSASAFWGDGYVVESQSGEGGALVLQPLYFTAEPPIRKSILTRSVLRI